MRILIIEDEFTIAKRLTRLAKGYFGDKIQNIMQCDSPDDGLEYITEFEIDLLLLDLNLNGEDGFRVLKEMMVLSFHTIIVSAYKEKAITAFEYGVLDFVPKPFNEKRLAQAFGRINAKKERSGLKFLAIQKRGLQHLIEVKDILYIKGARVYAEIVLLDGTTEIHNKSLDKLERLLPVNFERIHKSYLVDMNQANALLVASGGKYELKLKNNELIPVSRTRYKELKEKWFV